MTNHHKCNEFSEMLPLMLAGALQSDELRMLEEHLRSCKHCRELLDRERALFEAATIDLPGAPLAEQPESELLDRYVRKPESLSADELEQIKAYVAGNPHAQELIENLRSLPAELEELVDSSNLRMLERISQEEHQSKATVTLLGRFKQSLWRPNVAYAAAAAILLIAIFWQRPVGVGPASVNALLQASTRGNVKDQIIISPTEECYLNLTYCVDPETGHLYDIGLKQPGESSYLYRQSAIAEFDRNGCYTFRSLLRVGTYELTLYDIVEADTVTVFRRFRIQLSNQ